MRNPSRYYFPTSSQLILTTKSLCLTLHIITENMIEMTLEEDLPEEFRGGTLRIADNKLNGINSNASTPDKKDNVITNIIDDKETSKLTDCNTEKNCSAGQWGSRLLEPLVTVPTKISESLWKPKEKNNDSKTTIKSLQPSINVNEDADNFFTFRSGVVERALLDCVEQFVDVETEGPLVASYLLTQINYWDTDKERLILLTPKILVIAKYDFIALKRLGFKKLQLEDVDDIVIGDLVYPSGSLIPRLNGFADGISNVLENCLFARWSNNETKHLDNFYQPRDRNMKGVRINFAKGKQVDFKTKWNPFNENIPFWTLTFHPLYFNKDCSNETQRNLYNLESFIEKLTITLTDLKKNIDNCVVRYENILLENYVGLGSLIHNRNSLGFFKVRGKFSF